MTRGRRKPYTVIGVKRVRCFVKGCRQNGYAQWNVCVLDNEYKVVCAEHDIELNRLVLTWAGVRDADLLMARYIASVAAERVLAQ